MPLQTPTLSAVSQLATLLRKGPVAVITGAGLSTASGIPAYRDKDGQWQHTRPIQHQEFLRSDAVRRRYWSRSFVGWPTMGLAEPNRGHFALAALEQGGAVMSVITQNVDGLHQKAGSAEVIELHGSINQVRCLACQQHYPRWQMQEWLMAANPQFNREAAKTFRAAPDGDAHLDDAIYADCVVPHCPACSGMLKPDVVFFGDNVPRDRVAAAALAVDKATALLIVGSSLMVYSGFRFADQAHKLGKPIFMINQGITRADALLTTKIEADCSDTLEQLQRELDAPLMEIYG